MYKGKGVGRYKVPPIGWAHLYLSANFHNMLSNSIEEGRVYKEGRGRGGSLFYVLNQALGMGNLMPKLTLTPPPK